jgi:hypothetical protein
MNEILLYIGSAIIILWGIAHIIPTQAIVKGFGAISADNRKVLTMEIIAEGLSLIFLGVLPLLMTLLVGTSDKSAGILFFACAAMLLVMAVLTAVTGARTPTIWYKICPAVKTIVAVLFILGATL